MSKPPICPSPLSTQLDDKTPKSGSGMGGGLKRFLYDKALKQNPNMTDEEKDKLLIDLGLKTKDEPATSPNPASKLFGGMFTSKP